MQKLLTAPQLTTLTQALTAEPLGRLATFEKTATRFRRLLAARIGSERADAVAPTLAHSETLAAAQDRLQAILDDHDRPKPAVAEEAAHSARKARGPGSKAQRETAAKSGVLPEPPDFSAPTHARFRKKLADLKALAAAGDADGLAAFPINPISSSPKALARYRDLCLIALAARKGA